VLLLKLAFRNIFRQRRRSLLTALSMTGGYVLCAVAVSMTDGTFKSAIEIFTLDHTGHVQIHQGNYLQRPKIYKTIDLASQIVKSLDQSPLVDSYTLRVFAPALAYSDHGNTSAQVIGVDLDREKVTSRLAKKVTSGAYIDQTVDREGRYSAMIGAGIAEVLSLQPHDEIILISQAADGSVANDIFSVGAIIGSKDSIDKLKVFLPLSASQEFLSLEDKVHEVSLLIRDDDRSQEIAKALQQLLPDLTVSPWQVIEASFYQSMQTKLRGNRFTLGIILFIVFIGVLNTVLMSVLERNREFGVLKAIGSKPAAITGMITLEISLLALMSVTLGLIIALPIISWLATVGIEYPEPVEFGGIVLKAVKGEISIHVFLIPMMAILISSIAVSIPPGLRAARISPTEAMRSH